MRVLLLSVVAAFVLAGSAGAVKPPAVVSSISLDQSAVAFDDHVTFTTTVEKLVGWEYPMVAVSCYQDVNGDSVVDTDLLGPDIVFAWLDEPGHVFWLGEYASIWRQRGGGAASCRADLDAYGWKGGRESTRVLASVVFPAAG